MQHTLQFRPQTWDENIWQSVAVKNEYGVSAAFDHRDVILDIGAHIGSFTYLALDRGAGKVIAVEADPDNAHYLRHNIHMACGATDRAVLIGGAVWSHKNPDQQLFLTVTGTNTGGSTMMSDSGVPIARIPFGALVGLAIGIARRAVRLVKFDCEGSEWPILEEYLPLPRHPCSSGVEAFVGEYHGIQDTGRFPAVSHLEGPLDAPWLRARFNGNGYHFAHRGTAGGLGLFWAWKPGKGFADIEPDAESRLPD